MRALLALLFLAFPLACAAPDAPTREQKLAQKKPLKTPTIERFAIGDSFTYSNPTTVWQIVNIKTDRLVWQSNFGDRMETSPNPFLPALLWESSRYGTGRRNIAQKKGSLFPIQKGRRTRFTANTQTADGQIRNFTWNCIVGDKQKTSVPAGTFKTFEVLCQRQNADALIYRYAPDIARIVEFRTPGFGLAQATRRQLIGYDSLAGSAFQESQPDIETTATLPLLPSDIEQEKEIPPYRPTLPPVSPLPFAPPSDFFAPQQDSTPSKNPEEEKPETEPLRRLLEEALEEQQNRTPLLPQFQQTPETIPLAPTSPTSEEPPPSPSTTPSPENTTSAVLLGSYPSLSQARQAWQQISKNRDLVNAFAGRRYDIIRRNDETRGILYGLFAHPYVNAQAAQEVCDSVRQQFRRNACSVTAWKR